MVLNDSGDVGYRLNRPLCHFSLRLMSKSFKHLDLLKEEEWENTHDCGLCFLDSESFISATLFLYRLSTAVSQL